MNRIASYGTYVPRSRLDRAEIGNVLGPRSGKGTRSVASYDEDSTSMGVEAARAALEVTDVRPQTVLFATTSPPYQDKTNATAIHAALDLDETAGAYDMTGAVRSGIGAIRAGLESSSPTLVVLSDVRTGLPGSADEANGGDAATAFVFAPDGVAELIGSSSTTAEFLDRWRVPGEPNSRVWEERFGEHAYGPLVERAVALACKPAGLEVSAIDHVIVTGLHARAVRAALKQVGANPESVVDDLSATIGNTGAAHPGLLLASALDTASPGQTIALIALADGVDVLLFKATASAAPRTRAEQPTMPVSYANFLTWRGLLRREPPRRPDPVAPAAPIAFRREGWKFAFTASRCEECGTRHLPPQRVCVTCHAADRMTSERLADVQATIATYTIDRLAFSLSPPVVMGVLDFDGGGRYQCELTDVDPDTVKIGGRVEMTFRRTHTANGVHNYFWKARPIAGGE